MRDRAPRRLLAAHRLEFQTCLNDRELYAHKAGMPPVPRATAKADMAASLKDPMGRSFAHKGIARDPPIQPMPSTKIAYP